MSDTWKLWEGKTVAGKFPLVRFLGGSERAGVFLTERRDGERTEKAAIKLILANPEEGERQLSRWQLAAALSHPHLISLYEMGRFELRGVPLLYVVMEWADENLAEVVPGRVLTPAETHEMLAPVLDVLAYLHGKGFVHGHIKPANIMACGDRLKVSSDGLLRSGEPLDTTGDQSAYDPPEMARGILPISTLMSPAGDVWSLGMMLVEALTQNLPVARPAEQEDPQLPQSLPEPFLDMARHCLNRYAESRWTVAQVAARLEGRAATPQIQASPAKAQAPSRASAQQPSQPQKTPARARSYVVPITAGIALVLIAIFALPKLLRPRAAASQGDVAAGETQPVSPAPSRLSPTHQESTAKAAETSVAEEDRSSNPPVAVPAAIRSGTTHEEETSSVAKMPAGSVVRGDVVQQVLPEILPSARSTIQGRVKVSVKVNVDRSGNVEDAELQSPGPSKYFARAALKAAQDWKFKPPMVGGQGVLSTWTLRFDFKRDGTTVVPTQEMP